MKTKQKKDESKLYDFDYESKEEKKLKAKRKKAVKKSASKEAKKEANGKHGQVPEKKRYEDEIIKKTQKKLIKSFKKEGRMKKTEKNIMWGKLTKKVKDKTTNIIYSKMKSIIIKTIKK